MSGYQSRVRDAINQAAPTHASVAVADRGLSHFLDPSMTGVTRFMQKSGYPFPLLTPQISTTLATAATAGTTSVTLSSQRLLTWLRVGVVLSFELIESAEVASFTLLPDGNIQCVLTEALSGGHPAGSSVHLRSFVVQPYDEQVAGAGGLGFPVATLLSPFVLVPGDTITVNGASYSISYAQQTAPGALLTVEVKVSDPAGLPALATDSRLYVTARAVYQSQVLTLPHASTRSLIRGPVAVDWVSGPMVSDYRPTPESQVFVEEFDASGRSIVAAREMSKNDSLSRMPLLRDQMLFWNAIEGGVNWNGSFMELKAYGSGRAHLWTPCRPLLDAAAPVTQSATVTGFAPYIVLLNSNLLSDSIQVLDAVTKAEIPSTDYTVDTSTGNVTFDPAYAGAGVIITFNPRLEWQLVARPSVDDVELVVTVGREGKQTFPLGLAGSSTTCTIQTFTSDDIDQIHVTARRTDDSAGAFTVELGDWIPRGSQTAALRYTLLTGATVDYDWASSGLMLKALWPNLELLRARLDGDSIFARYLDNGRMLL